MLDGLEIISPDRWSLESRGDRDTLTFLASLGTEDHQALERILERHRNAEGPDVYFAVTWTGITDTPVRMRFGKCLWQVLA